MLLLDSEALSALAHGPASRRLRVRALVAEMHRRGLPVATAAAILAEVIRGRPQDSGVFACLSRARVQCIAVDRRVGARAGQLIGAVGGGSEMAADAFLVAVADLLGGAVIASTDERGLHSLADHASHVLVTSITG